jgi:hypothetical protein
MLSLVKLANRTAPLVPRREGGSHAHKVAFICVHNSGRSQIGEALAKISPPSFLKASQPKPETKPKNQS